MIAGKNRYRPNDTYNNFKKLFGNTTEVPVVFEKTADIPKDSKFYVFVDTETSGLDSDVDELLQFSGMKFAYTPDGILILVDIIDQFIKNEYPIDPKASKVNHIDAEFLKDKPEKEEAFKTIDNFLHGVDAFIAYNTPFDLMFVKSFYEKCGYEYSIPNSLDVMAMFIDLVSMYKSEKRNLASAAKYLNIKEEATFHNALDDIKITVKVFAQLANTYAQLPAPQEECNDVPQIWKHWVWNNPNRHIMQRIYFSTPYGKIFYEKLDRSFGTDGTVNIKDINMEAFVQKVLRYFKLDTLESLTHFKDI